EEQALARRCHDSGDCVAANKLVTSHLRLVAKIAMAYRGYGLPIAEIISEGALGLLRAVRRFDADRGFRLATYATFWIRAAIQDYILRSWSLVKVATTASQRRLFFNLRKTKARIAALDDDLRASQVVQIARRLGVSEKDVNEMNPRLHGDVSLNVSPNREGEGEWQDLLADESESQEAVLLEQDERRNRAAALQEALSALAPRERRNRAAALQEALSALAPRERRIFVARRLADDPITLDRLSIEFRVSRERVRQIERRVFEKVQAAAKKSLAEREAPPAILAARAAPRERTSAKVAPCAILSESTQTQPRATPRFSVSRGRRLGRNHAFSAGGSPRESPRRCEGGSRPPRERLQAGDVR